MLPQSKEEVKHPSIADLRSLEPAKREAAEAEFVMLDFEAGKCMHCADHPAMRIFLRKSHTRHKDRLHARMVELCPVCKQGDPAGPRWLNRQRTLEIIEQLVAKP
jgi:hypothetical protein